MPFVTLVQSLEDLDAEPAGPIGVDGEVGRLFPGIATDDTPVEFRLAPWIAAKVQNAPGHERLADVDGHGQRSFCPGELRAGSDGLRGVAPVVAPNPGLQHGADSTSSKMASPRSVVRSNSFGRLMPAI